MRVLTWNIWWHFWEWEARRPLVAGTVLANRPDVVLLQEASPDQAEAVAEACGLSVVGYFGTPLVPAFSPELADVPFGNAVLADPATVSEPLSLDYRNGDGRAQRGAVGVFSTVLGPKVFLASTHLSSSVDAGAVRSQQMEQITAWVDELGADGPAVIGGDLNQVPSSDEYRSSIEPHWVDLWTMARPGEPGSTMVAGNPNIAGYDWMGPRNGPGGPTDGVRFDYLLARRGGAKDAGGLRVASIEVIGTAVDGWPSDHCGVVAELTVS
ncbi:MAG: endonuclease/exonuclease/phosphatase family protein [Actinomycetota bacterium]